VSLTSTASAAPLTDEDRRVLALLPTHTYDEIRALTRWSRGRIYHLALQQGARKTEARIRERAAERRARQLEFLAATMGTTTTADVLDFLDGLPDDSVQLVLTSPPYNLGKRYGDGPSADTMRAVYYHGWLMQVISEAARILREGGVLALQVGQTRDHDNRLMPLDVLLFEDTRRAGLTFQSRVVWTTPHGLTPRTRLAERYETLLVCSKGPAPTFNPTAARLPQKQPGKRAFKGPRRGHLSGHPLGAWPTNVWKLHNVGHHSPDRRFGAHPAAYPLALARRAVLLYSRPGDVICDPFSGSGTTQVAAIETGRAFVGADLFYADLRSRRVAAARPDVVTPLPGVTDDSLAVWQAEARRVDVPASAMPTGAEEQFVMTFCRE
jgi:DNA modification methylase